MVRTQIFANNEELDIFEDIPMSLNYSIVDIREPQKKKSNFSKTVNIPGSKKNNILFTQIFEADISVQTGGSTNFSPDFNPNLKTPVVVTIDRIEVFKGVLQLVNISMIEEDQITYQCVLKGRLADIYTNMGDKKLEDLDLSDFDHSYTKFDEAQSWDDSIKENGVHVPFEKGKGYVYPMIDYGFNDENVWVVTEFYPAIYAKQYIDKIFETNDFQVESNFFDSDYFKSLVIPLNTEEFVLSEANLTPQLFQAERTSLAEVAIGTAVFILFNDDSTSPNFDNNANYNNVTGIWTVTERSYYNIRVVAKASVRYTNSGTIGSGSVTHTLRLFRGSKILNASLHVFAREESGTHTTAQATVLINRNDILLEVGDEVRVQLKSVNTAGVTGFLQLNDDSLFFNEVNNKNLIEGNNVLINEAIPKDIKQRDFFTSILKLFNLYVTADTQVSNKLFIEPRDDFYSSGVTRNWDQKLVIDKAMDSRPMGELDFRNFVFTYDKDDDYYNKRYFDKYAEVYGEHEESIDNDFLKNTVTDKVIFGATPLYGTTAHDRVYPRIVSVDQDGTVKKKKSKIRLLFYGGLKSTNVLWQHGSSTGSTFNSTFPYAGHLDDVSNPDEDINFGVPREVYYEGINGSAIKYTNNNLFNKYHKGGMNEITDANARLVTAFFKLDPTDILELDFRDRYYFNGQYYRLNKIMDYNPIANELTKCEFIKILEGVPFVKESKDIFGGRVVFGNGDDAPMSDAPQPPRDNVFNSNPAKGQQVL